MSNLRVCLDFLVLLYQDKRTEKILWLQQWNFSVLVPGFDLRTFFKTPEFLKYSNIFIKNVMCGVGKAKCAERSCLPWFFGSFVSRQKNRRKNFLNIEYLLFCFETKKATGIGGCVKKFKKETIYKTFLSFALIGLRCYCELSYGIWFIWAFMVCCVVVNCK